MQNINPWHKLLRALYLIEDSLIVVLLAGLIVISVSQIVLRNFLDDGLIWAEPLLRIMVLWLGLVGAMVATRHAKQIKIDILNKLYKGKLATLVKIFNKAFPAAICMIAAYYSYEFTLMEYSYSSYAFEKVPSWITVAIIPIAFCIMSLRYIAQLVTGVDQRETV